MKLELEILKKVLKKNIIWYALFICFVIFQIIIILLKPSIISIQLEDFLAVIGDPKYYDYTYDTVLLKFFQVILIIYYVYQICSYEYQFSFENFLLRLDEKYWIKIKIFLLTSFFVLTKVVFILFVYLFFANNFELSFAFFYPSLIYDVLIVLLTITFTNFLVKNNLSLLMLLVLICSFLLLIFFDWMFIILANIVFIIVNVSFFKFKRVINE